MKLTPEVIEQLKAAGRTDLIEIHKINQSGYAGVKPNGNIVDRRKFPYAVAVQENPMMDIPKSKPLTFDDVTCLTKENFWNEAMQKYPKATKLFCDWIDEYKKAVGWGKLFNNHFSQSNIKRAANGEIYSIDFSTPKFHDLPYEMQQGIWIRFANETLNKFFEQPEYEYSFDLAEDIKTVFGEINDLIDDE